MEACYWSAASTREDVQLEAVDFTFGWYFTIPLVLVELPVVLVFISPMPNILHLLAIVTAFPLSHSPTHSAFIPARTSQLICVTRSTPSCSRQRSLRLECSVPLVCKNQNKYTPQQRFQILLAISEDMRHYDQSSYFYMLLNS